MPHKTDHQSDRYNKPTFVSIDRTSKCHILYAYRLNTKVSLTIRPHRLNTKVSHAMPHKTDHQSDRYNKPTFVSIDRTSKCHILYAYRLNTKVSLTIRPHRLNTKVSHAMPHKTDHQSDRYNKPTFVSIDRTSKCHIICANRLIMEGVLNTTLCDTACQ